jgi:ribulose-phosphate 3-epimerase
MIVEPDRYLEDFAAAGADALTVHEEACVHLHRTVQHIRKLGKKVGVSLNPHTPIEGLRIVLPELDSVLIMTVNPGFGGQVFIPEVLPKIRELRAEIVRRGLSTEISVDGGISPRTAASVGEAGGNILVAGAAIFGQADYAQAIAAIRAEATRGWAAVQKKS